VPETIAEVRVALLNALAIANMIADKTDREFIMPTIENAISRTDLVTVFSFIHRPNTDNQGNNSPSRWQWWRMRNEGGDNA